jgi:hypothetical protein
VAVWSGVDWICANNGGDSAITGCPESAVNDVALSEFSSDFSYAGFCGGGLSLDEVQLRNSKDPVAVLTRVSQLKLEGIQPNISFLGAGSVRAGSEDLQASFVQLTDLVLAIVQDPVTGNLLPGGVLRVPRVYVGEENIGTSSPARAWFDNQLTGTPDVRDLTLNFIGNTSDPHTFQFSGCAPIAYEVLPAGINEYSDSVLEIECAQLNSMANPYYPGAYAWVLDTVLGVGMLKDVTLAAPGEPRLAEFQGVFPTRLSFHYFGMHLNATSSELLPASTEPILVLQANGRVFD